MPVGSTKCDGGEFLNTFKGASVNMPQISGSRLLFETVVLRINVELFLHLSPNRNQKSSSPDLSHSMSVV